jgi:hypothetical protein
MAIAAAAAVASVGVSVHQGNKQMKAQKSAAAQSMKDAADTKATNERAINQANQKRPDLSSIFAQNLGLNSGGVGSTMLTGPGGAKMGAGLLGKSTLLGA